MMIFYCFSFIVVAVSNNYISIITLIKCLKQFYELLQLAAVTELRLTIAASLRNSDLA